MCARFVSSLVLVVSVDPMIPLVLMVEVSCVSVVLFLFQDLVFAFVAPMDYVS